MRQSRLLCCAVMSMTQINFILLHVKGLIIMEPRKQIKVKKKKTNKFLKIIKVLLWSCQKIKIKTLHAEWLIFFLALSLGKCIFVAL